MYVRTSSVGHIPPLDIFPSEHLPTVYNKSKSLLVCFSESCMIYTNKVFDFFLVFISLHVTKILYFPPSTLGKMVETAQDCLNSIYGWFLEVSDNNSWSGVTCCILEGKMSRGGNMSGEECLSLQSQVICV